MTELRVQAMRAMNNMDIYKTSKHKGDREQGLMIAKTCLTEISQFTGVPYEALYKALLNTDLTNYNMDWLRELIKDNMKDVDKKTRKKIRVRI